MDQHLKPFGVTHWLIMLSVPALTGLLTWVSRRWPHLDWGIRNAMGWMLVAAGLPWYVYRWTVMGVKLPQGLPLELCDVTLWLAVFALLTKRQWIFELSYYWGVAGATMAIVTPSLHAPMWSYPTITYFLSHGGIVAGTLYLLWSGQCRPRAGSWWWAWVGLNGFAAVVGIVDVAFKTNYFFLRATPESRSLLDYFGKWPWYLVVTDVFALGLFGVMGMLFGRRHQRRLRETVSQKEMP